MDAVGVEILAVFQAFGHLFVVLFSALFVWPLDASSGRGVVACGGQTDHGAVGKVEGTLHQSLAKRAATDDHATVVVLDGT